MPALDALLVAIDAPDGLLLHIGGCAHLYGGEQALVADLGERIARAGFAYTIAIAGTIGAAWAAAHYGEPASYAAVSKSDFAVAVAAIGTAASPPTPWRRWRASASERIGDIIDLPRSPAHRALRR